MIIDKTIIDGCFVFSYPKHEDRRGYFSRIFCNHDNIITSKINFDLKQSSVGYNKKAKTARGLHYQESPFGENKIITCLSGAVDLFVVDLRDGSPTYNNSLIRRFDEKSKYTNSIYIPKQCATGYVTLEDNTMLLYHMDEFFYDKHKRTINFLNKDINLDYNFEGVIISDSDGDAKWKHS